MAATERPLRLLSLDGGGVRGLSELIILKRLMFNLGHKLGRGPDDLPKPSEFFDLIGGTSTGGLIAIMLGTLGMDIDTCIGHYLAMAPDIFPEEGFVAGSKFGKLVKGATGMESFVQKLVEKKFPQVGPQVVFDAINTPESERQCKVFVCATNSDTSTTFRLRDYTSGWEPSTLCKIWEAARATSAAPLFFPPVRFGTPPQNWVDGGLRANNPIRHVYDEANTIWPGRRIQCIVSIGAGEAPAEAVGTRGDEIISTLVRISLDTKQTDTEFLDALSHLPAEARPRYFRFNTSNIHSIGLEEWKHADKLTGLTNAYLNDHREEVNECASILENGSSRVLLSRNFQLTRTPVSAPEFFGRNNELSQMGSILDPSKKGQQRLVIYGPSGFGKTQIALQFVEKGRLTYDFILWIDASSPDATLESFDEAAIALDGLGISKLPRGIPGLSSNSGNTTFVMRWLETTSSTWLIVIDSLDDIENVQASKLFPRCSFGSVVVTTTRHDFVAASATHGIEATALDDQDGSALLLSKLDAQTSIHIDPSQAKSVVQDLAGVPLAIEQAGALLARGFTMHEFQKHYQNQYDMLMRNKPASSAWTYDRNRSIINAFETTYSTLASESGSIANFLSILCFFGAGQLPLILFDNIGAIPETSLEVGGDHALNSILQKLKWIATFSANNFDLNFSASRLQDFCLAKMRKNLKGAAVSISVHDSIRKWGRERGDKEDAKAWSFIAAYLLSCYSKTEGNQGAFITLDSRLGAHFAFCFSSMKKLWHSPPNGPLTPVFSSVMIDFGRCFSQRGNHAFAKEALTFALEGRIQYYGDAWTKDRTSCELLFAIADAKWQLGERESATQAFQDLLNVGPVSSGEFDDIAVRAATKLRLINDRSEAARRAATSTTNSQIGKISLPNDGHQFPPHSTDAAQESGFEQYADEEYSLTEIVNLMLDEFGADDDDTAEARIALASFYEKHGQHRKTQDAIVPVVNQMTRKARSFERYVSCHSLRMYPSRTRAVHKAASSCLIRSAEEVGNISDFAEEMNWILVLADNFDDQVLARLALRAGARPDFEPYGNNESILMLAMGHRRYGMVGEMLKHCVGIDISKEASYFLAAARGDTKLLRMLLEAGVDAAFEPATGMTLMHIAASTGEINVVDRLRSLGQDVKM